MNAAGTTRAERRWIVAWPAGALVGVANGILRETTYARRVDEQTAHQVSGITAVVAFSVLFRALDQRWPLPSRRSALRVGMAWLLMTLGFEFGFGRLVAKQTWSELMADYDVVHGRTWPLVLLWITIGPAVVSRRHTPRLTVAAPVSCRRGGSRDGRGARPARR